MVRDKVITGAIRKAYRNSIPASAYPVVILFLEMPFDAVDVNAHPAKTEVRFRDQSAVHRLILDTVEQALVQNAAIPDYAHRSPGGQISGNLEVPSISSVPENSPSRTERIFDFLPPQINDPTIPQPFVILLRCFNWHLLSPFLFLSSCILSRLCKFYIPCHAQVASSVATVPLTLLASCCAKKAAHFTIFSLGNL